MVGLSGDWTLCEDIPAGNVGAIATVAHDRFMLFVGTSDGVYKSRDRGKTWRPAGDALRGLQVWALLVHPSVPGLVYAGTGPCRLFCSEDYGETWLEASIERSGEVFSVADDGKPLPFAARVTGLTLSGDAHALYAALEVEGVLRSIDGGRSWSDTSDRLFALADACHLQEKLGTMDPRKSMADGHAVTAAPTGPDALFYANRLGVFRSDDGGRQWQDIRLDRFSAQTYVRSIVASRHDPQTIHACLSIKASGDDGGIWRSRDGGASWRRIDPGLNPGSTMMNVCAHPQSDDVLFAVSYNGGVFGTLNAGEDWHRLPLPADASEAFAVACA